MKIGIIISQIDHETVWNAIRFANFSLQKKHTVKIFLIGKGVECEEIKDEKFNVQEQLSGFIEQGGTLFACGTCLKIRKKHESTTCSLSTMQDLLALVEKSDKVLTF